MSQKAKKKNAFRDSFGHLYFLKRTLIFLLGSFTYNRYNGFNKLKVTGTQKLVHLPEQNVLFVSNHQTYFADVVAMFHVFNASLSGREDSIKNVGYLWQPKMNIYYVAASETMKAGLLPRILSYVGAITVERTWRAGGKDVTEKREVNPNDTENIKIALEDGWVITFPQGTTRSFKPVRKGTAHIILQHKPVVVPIVIDGFRRSFDRKGLMIKKKGILQSMVIKEPLTIDYETATVDEVVEMIEFAIEQHPSLLKVIPSEVLDEQAKLDRERMWKY